MAARRDLTARLTDAERMERAAHRVATPTEAQLQAQIVELAGTLGYLVYHPWLSIRSAAGFPDLTLARGRRLVFAELKVKGRTLSQAQQRWRAALLLAGAEYYVWRDTDDMQEIADILGRDAA